jgi:hypothetical protein
MKKLLLAVALFALSCSAQTSPTVQVAGARLALNRFIELNAKGNLQTQEARKLLTGEASAWDVPTFGKLSPSTDKVELLADNSAVGRVQWFGENDYVADLYFYLLNDHGWKIHTMRRLALTGIVEMAYQGLKAKSTLTSEERETMENAELVLASDATLKQWFANHHSQLDSLRSMMSQLPKQIRSVSRTDETHTQIAKQLSNLNVSVVERSPAGNLEVVIGGMTDNTVGFGFSPQNKPPAIDPSNYIWVESVGAGWYLFRTT